MEHWKARANPDLKFEDFATTPCVMPIDLASKIDIAARINLFYWVDDDGKLQYRCISPWFYLPEDTVYNGEELLAVGRYQKWVNQGLIEVHDGAENNLNAIAEDLISDGGSVPLSEVPYDEWGGFQVAKTIEDAGYDTVKIPKTVKTFSPAMRELEAALKSGRFQHDGNPVLGWMAGNVVAREDANGNVFPRKETNAKKIDGIVALLMGISRAMVLAGVDNNDDDFYDNPIVVGT